MHLPRIPSYEEASMAAGEYPTSPMSPLSHLSKKIDQTKLKTKVCRYYLLGATCPFGENCAFSHSDAAMASPPAPAFAMTTKGATSVSSEDLSKSASTNLSDTQSSGDAGEAPERVVFGQPPPAYAEAMKESESFAAAAGGMAAPPMYPKRFRFDPYSVNWIAYERTA